MAPSPMTTPHPMLGAPEQPTAYCWSGHALRSRSVSATVLSGRVDVPAPPARLRADWNDEITRHLDLAPGDVEALPLARTRARWPGFQQCLQAAADWTGTQGFKEVLATSDMALMASLGTNYHHDAEHYGGMAFCNLFLSEDCGLDVHFPVTGHRIPLVRGTVLVFDTGQPHALIERHSGGSATQACAPHVDRSHVFLTRELPLENTDVGQALGVTFDTDPVMARALDEEQVWLHGARARVCPASGRWC